MARGLGMTWCLALAALGCSGPSSGPSEEPISTEARSLDPVTPLPFPSFRLALAAAPQNANPSVPLVVPPPAPSAELLAEEADKPPAALIVPLPEKAQAELDAALSGPAPHREDWMLPVKSLPERGERVDASRSIGNTTTGRLEQGRAVPVRGPHHRVIPRTQERGYVYGADYLVEALQAASAVVAEQYPGSVLRVGNLSRQDGGDIPQSVSHNSGRDVDVGFFVTTERGMATDVVGYPRFDADGQSENYEPPVYFDSARNWALVRALIEEPRIQVQYLFVADWLKTLLVDYAIRAGESRALVVAAERMMMQPKNSSPHAEHFHLRVYCDRHDRLHGCHDFGVRHPWAQTFDDDVQGKIDALVEMYQSKVPEQRAAALAQLDLLTKPPAVEPERPEEIE